jgi:hypothetical protein
MSCYEPNSTNPTQIMQSYRIAVAKLDLKINYKKLICKNVSAQVNFVKTTELQGIGH